jgi:predicted dehydrogenase
MVNIGVIGFGYWGPNLVRNFNSAKETQFIAVADLDKNRLREVIKNFPAVHMRKFAEKRMHHYKLQGYLDCFRKNIGRCY